MKNPYDNYKKILNEYRLGDHVLRTYYSKERFKCGYGGWYNTEKHRSEKLFCVIINKEPNINYLEIYKLFRKNIFGNKLSYSIKIESVKLNIQDQVQNAFKYLKDAKKEAQEIYLKYLSGFYDHYVVPDICKRCRYSFEQVSGQLLDDDEVDILKQDGIVFEDKFIPWICRSCYGNSHLKMRKRFILNGKIS